MEKIASSTIKWDLAQRLYNQAMKKYDGQYQKVYTKYCTPDRDELSVEMMSTRCDQFKYRMAARIDILSKEGCMNYRNNIIMIFHKDFNYYQFLANEDGTTFFS